MNDIKLSLTDQETASLQIAINIFNKIFKAGNTNIHIQYDPTTPKCTLPSIQSSFRKFQDHFIVINKASISWIKKLENQFASNQDSKDIIKHLNKGLKFFNTINDYKIDDSINQNLLACQQIIIDIINNIIDRGCIDYAKNAIDLHSARTYMKFGRTILSNNKTKANKIYNNMSIPTANFMNNSLYKWLNTD